MYRSYEEEDGERKRGLKSCRRQFITRMTLLLMDSSLQDMESDELRGRTLLGGGRSDGVSDDDDRRLRVYEQLFGIL